MAKRLLIAHGTDLLVRGFNTTPPDRFTPDGRAASGLFATCGVIRRGLDLKPPDWAICVLDARGAGESADPHLAQQAAELGALFEAHGFHVIASERPAELIASYVAAARAANASAVVLASDKRFAQLVEENTVWWYDGYKRVRYTPTRVQERFLVGPERVAEWLALVGDDTALAGVKGVGAKGAAGFLSEVDDLHAALDEPDALPGRVGKAIRAALEQAKDQLTLAHFARDLPLPSPLEAVALQPRSVPEINAAYAELGFYSLLRSDGEPPVAEILDDAPQALLDGPAASLSVITEAPSAVRGEWVGLAVVSPAGRYYFRDVGPRLKAWLEDANTAKTGHDTKNAAVALARRGVALAGVVGDSNFASHLLDPSGSAPHELEAITRTQLKRPLTDETRLTGTGAGTKRWSELPVAAVSAFACERAQAAHALCERLGPRVDPAHFAEYHALSQVLVRMELAGMPVDSYELSGAGTDFDAILAELEEQIYALAGREFNLASPKQLGQVLYRELSLTVYGRTKTGWSSATHVLERLLGDHPIVAEVIRHRMIQRLKSHWITALQAAISPDGRVRSTFHPARSFSGRLVNSTPDLGRVPGQTPEMARIRRAFVASPGHTLLSVDYTQLGLYVLAHLTRDPALVEPLSRGADMHVATASAVLELEPSEVGPDERQIGKVTNFATFAGQGASSLRKQLGVSVDVARQIIDRFYSRYSRVAEFQEAQLRLCQDRGWVETLSGRRWPIRDVFSNDAQMRGYGERLARRAPHEGSVADVTRRALLRADQALRAAGSGAIPLLQVHDEVIFEVPDNELETAAQLAADAFRGAYDLVVPLRVSCKAGRNWADMKPLRNSQAYLPTA